MQNYGRNVFGTTWYDMFPCMFPYILSIMKQTIAVRLLEWMAYDKLIILISPYK